MKRAFVISLRFRTLVHLGLVSFDELWQIIFPTHIFCYCSFYLKVANCTPRAENLGNVLLTNRNPPNYFYQWMFLVLVHLFVFLTKFKTMGPIVPSSSGVQVCQQFNCASFTYVSQGYRGGLLGSCKDLIGGLARMVPLGIGLSGVWQGSNGVGWGLEWVWWGVRQQQ